MRIWMALLPVLLFSAGLVIPACTGTTPFLHFPLGSVAPAGPSPIHGVRQLVVVVASDWDESEGLLQTWERFADGVPWRSTGSKVPVRGSRTSMTRRIN